MPSVRQNCENSMPNKIHLRAATAVSLLVLSTSVRGNTSAMWDGASATWSDGSHWSTNPIAPDNNSPPGAVYDVTVNGGIITLDTSPTINNLMLSTTVSSIPATLSGPGTLTVNG